MMTRVCEKLNAGEQREGHSAYSAVPIEMIKAALAAPAPGELSLSEVLHQHGVDSAGRMSFMRVALEAAFDSSKLYTRLGKVQADIADIRQEMASIEPTEDACLLAHSYEDWRKALDFALDKAGGEGDTFLRSWREGDWQTLDNEWPEWKALFQEAEPRSESIEP